MNVTLQPADLADAELLWEMQKESFCSTYETYRDEDTTPYLEPLERTQMRLREPITSYYVIRADGIPVGGIRVRDQGRQAPKVLGPVYVLPEHRGKGIAQQAIRLVEEIHGSKNWLLDTIMQEKGNCRLYEKMGYRYVGISKVVNERMTLVYYKK